MRPSSSFVNIIPVAVGTMLNQRYLVTEVLRRKHQFRRYAVQDTQQGNRATVLRQYAIRGDRETLIQKAREMTFLHRPGLCMPYDLFVESHSMFAVEAVGRGRTLERCVLEDDPTLAQVVEWVIRLCDLYAPLHQRKHPIVLGTLGIDNVMLSDEGSLQLVGLELEKTFTVVKLEPLSEENSWTAPDENFDVRSDVWCVGRLLQRLIELKTSVTPLARAAVQETDRILECALAVDAAVRYSSVAQLKARLQELAKCQPELLQHRPRRLPPAPAMAGRKRAALTGMALVLVAMALIVAAGSSLIQAYVQCCQYCAFTWWSRVDALSAAAPGTVIWVDGIARASSGTVEDAFAAQPSIGYEFVVTHKLRHEVLDRSRHTYQVNTTERVALQLTRCQPFDLCRGNSCVRVVSEAAFSMLEGSDIHWQVNRKSMPPTVVGKAQIPLFVRPGEILQELVVHQARLAADDRVCVRAAVARAKDGQTMLGPPPAGPVLVYDGGRGDWTMSLFRHLAPALSRCVLSCILLYLVGRTLYRRRLSEGIAAAEDV